MVEGAVRLEQVAVTVPVALVLDVVVRPAEPGGPRRGLTASIAIWPVPSWLSGCPTSLASPASQESAEYQASEWGSISQGEGAPSMT